MNCKIAERVSAQGDAGEIESHERMKMSSKWINERLRN